MKKENGKYILIFFLIGLWAILIAAIIWVEQGNTIPFLTGDSMNEPSFARGPVPESNQEINENSIEYIGAPRPVSENFSFSEEVIQRPTDPIQAISLCGDFVCFSGDEFVDLYNRFEQAAGMDSFAQSIFGDQEIDLYLENAAVRRGYQRRGFADSSDLISYYSLQTRREVRDAYISLRNEMSEEGIQLHFVSGYRSADSQRSIFLSKFNPADVSLIISGVYDQELDDVLALSALPGYSKHHSGYAVDFGCGNDYLVYAFAETECYSYLSANNFENAKRFGFIPSYPEGVQGQGPNPEPWEYVWVGRENIR